MKHKWAAIISFIGVALVLGTASLPAASIANEDGMIWTQWDADHYAMVDDGETIWIGSGSGLIRWDKASSTYTRITTVEGLPHRRVFSAAVDGVGNLWFGGDGGLSRLAKNGVWRHYDMSNSGIFSDSVDGIAVTVDGSVWLSHTESPHVSRLQGDNSWAIFPNRQTAVALAFETIKQTSSSNNLWTVAGDEVWVDYDIFDGTEWENHKPDEALGPPLTVLADSKNKVWTLHMEAVFSWDGTQWEIFMPVDWGYHTSVLSTLFVDENDEVWVGGTYKGSPYDTSPDAGYNLLPDEPGYFTIEHGLSAQPPFAALRLTDEGMWGIGPNWLLTPDDNVTQFTDSPYSTKVSEVVVDQQGRSWIKSGEGLQTLDDMGTATMADDEWARMVTNRTTTVLEPASNGDIWVNWVNTSRGVWPDPPIRYHGNAEIMYKPPFEKWVIDDIYALDDQHIWFAYSDQFFTPETENRGVWSLHDGGTPADFTDDVWAQVPINTDGSDGIVAVVDNQLWYGDTSGLYRYQDPDWERISRSSVEELVPGANGELYVDLENDWRVLIVEQDGRQHFSSVSDLVENDLARVQATNRRNQMWTVAPDGAVWYWWTRWFISNELVRRDEQGITKINTPARSDYVEVDENNRVWLADGALWRMSPEPYFSLEIGPSSWLMMPNGSRSGRVIIESNEGYQETVDLSISGLPAGVTAEIVPESLPAGESAVLTVTTDGAALGETTITIKGASGMLNRQRSFKLAVVEYATDSLLAVVAK